MQSHDSKVRWKCEAQFFDREAESAMANIRPVHPSTLERYGALKRRRFSKEFRFRTLGSLDGKSVLDVGCGNGINAMNFARLGAMVTGVDISPKAIQLAELRAEINGVSRRTRFVCSPLELADFEAHSFDVVWGDAILHHLIPDLDSVVRQLVRWAKPGGIVMFAEPMNLSPLLRKLRMLLPLETDATPDERPLEQSEMEIVKRHLPGLRCRHFSLLSRLNRFVLLERGYETSPWPRRAVASSLNLIDFLLLSVPGVRALGATCVMYARVTQ